jgi:hypothetical protein
VTVASPAVDLAGRAASRRPLPKQMRVRFGVVEVWLCSVRLCSRVRKCRMPSAAQVQCTMAAGVIEQKALPWEPQWALKR